MFESGQKPNLFIPGSPKSGTTSLANWLAAHPRIFVPCRKEPHFFNDFLKEGLALESYAALYRDVAPEHLFRVDASTSYFTNPATINRVLDFEPEAKFVVMLRNPVDLAYSLHSEALFRGTEAVDDFAHAWSLQEQRRHGSRIPVSCLNSEMLLYYEQSLQGRALEFLLSATSRSHVHWIFFEELCNDPQAVYKGVLDFLELEYDKRTNFPHLNKAKRHRFPRLNRASRILGHLRRRAGLPGIGVRRLLTAFGRVDSPRAPMSADLRASLYRDFAADIALLEEVTERSLTNWKSVNAGATA